MKTIIIAEAGVNHNGNLKKALKLVSIAKKSGADYVKFQTFIPEEIVTKNAKIANYQKRGNIKYNQYKLLKKISLSFSDQRKIFKYCKKKKIKFLSTAFDLKSLDFLLKLGMDYIKIPSGEITNYPLLRKISKIKKKIILSTGASTFKDIGKALNVLKSKKKILTIMHCNSSYPTPLKDVNLNVLKTMKKKYKYNVGYSDHTLSLAVPLGSVALGATIIEKHFTDSRKSIGPDHKSSLEPKELNYMVKLIKDFESALGSSKKIVTKSEMINRNIIRKSIVASKKINKGEKFNINNITSKRPGNGISPMDQKKVIGKIAIKNFNKDEKIKI